MFTGLIEEVGTVARLMRSGSAVKLAVSTSVQAAEVRLGDSVAVSGVCLTVTAIDGTTLEFDVSPETLDRSALKEIRVGATVNLERALRLSDRLGGHIVSGHVDCTASITERREISGNLLLFFNLPREFTRYVVAKGSIAIDGISLTVNAVAPDGFSVNIIPHTAERTTIGGKRVGDLVNIEVDILAKYVERMLEVSGRSPERAGLTLDMLAKSGYL
jgi:riboflavin synthase